MHLKMSLFMLKRKKPTGNFSFIVFWGFLREEVQAPPRIYTAVIGVFITVRIELAGGGVRNTRKF